MIIDVKLGEPDNGLYRQTIPDDHPVSGSPPVSIDGGLLLVGRQTRAGGFLLCDRQRPVRLVQRNEDDLVQLHFLLQGGTWQARTPDGVMRVLTAGQHTISYHPPSSVEVDLTAPAEPIDYFTIYVPQALYFQLVPPASTLHTAFARRIKQKQAAYLASQNLPITPVMSRLIDAIRQCQREGELQRLYIQAKAVELLMLQLEQHQQHQVERGQQRPPDEQKVREAKAILESRFAHPPTISELARLVGLNEFKLKKGFRELVGCPIHRYVVTLRMEQAREWLLDRNKSVGDIAHYVGYKNHAHFTAAYKQYYDSLPSELIGRKNG